MRITLEPEVIEKTLRQAHEMGCKILNISGGEPFIHVAGLMKALEVSSELGYNTTIYSSGIYFNNSVTKKTVKPGHYQPIPLMLLDLVKDSGVNKIIFNMQAATTGLHETITQIDAIAMECIDESVRRAISKGIDTEINVVPMKCNLDHIEETVNHAFRLGCGKVNLLGLVMQGRCLQNKDRIVMSDADDHKLNLIIQNLKRTYGDKIRVGAPLSENPSERCYAGFGRLDVCYDGRVTVCEAFKGRQECNGHKPLNIRDHSLQEIVNAGYIQGIIKEVKGYKNATCTDCPAQQSLNYKCAYDPDGDRKLPDFTERRSPSSKDVFKAHMESYLASSKDELTIEEKISIGIHRNPIIERNYLIINSSAFDINAESKYIYALETLKGRTIKALATKPIEITSDYANDLLHGKFRNMTEYDFREINTASKRYEAPDRIKYQLFPEPAILANDIPVSEEAITVFYEQYLKSATYPDSNPKVSIAVSMNDKYSEYLENMGFTLVDTGKEVPVHIYAYLLSGYDDRINAFELVKLFNFNK